MKNKILTILVVIILIVATALTTYIICDKRNGKDNNTTTNNKEPDNKPITNDTTPETKPISNDLTAYNTYKSKIDIWLNSFSMIPDYKDKMFFSNSNTNTDSWANDEKMFWLLNFFQKNEDLGLYDSANSLIRFNENDAKNKVFEDISFLDYYKDGKEHIIDNVKTVTYKDNEFTVSIIPTGRDDMDLSIKKPFNSEINNDNLTVDINYVYARFNYDEGYYNTYKSYNDTNNAVEKINYSMADNTNIEDLIDYNKYDTYRFTFKVVDDNLLLKTITKI